MCAVVVCIWRCLFLILSRVPCKFSFGNLFLFFLLVNLMDLSACECVILDNDRGTTAGELLSHVCQRSGFLCKITRKRSLVG